MSGKKYRRLIEEIVEVLQHIYKAGRDGELPKEGSNVYAQQFITRILQAVVDGMPLPGEVGRGILEEREPVIEWPTKNIKEHVHKYLKILIALPPPGTGKEEGG